MLLKVTLNHTKSIRIVRKIDKKDLGSEITERVTLTFAEYS